jgi:hypothetical protein
MPATVSGAMYLSSSLSPAAIRSPRRSSAAANGRCDASTDKSLGSNPAASSVDTARRKCSRSGKEATASRTTGKGVDPVAAIVILRCASGFAPC